MLKAVIVDDEIAAIDSLEILLDNCQKDITVAGKASNIDDAQKTIAKTKPDVVFLDIEMPNGSGFDLLDRFDSIDFSIIFITAFNQYAIKAFKYAAVDYILKPVDINTLCSAIGRINNTKTQDNSEKLSILQESIDNDKPQRIALSTQDSIEIVYTDDIIQLEAEGNYTKVYTLHNKPIIISRTIKDYEEFLPTKVFFRSHKSHLINFKHIKKVYKNQNYIEMVDNNLAYISRRKKNEFFEAMNAFITQ